MNLKSLRYALIKLLAGKEVVIVNAVIMIVPKVPGINLFIDKASEGYFKDSSFNCTLDHMLAISQDSKHRRTQWNSSQNS